MTVLRTNSGVTNLKYSSKIGHSLWGYCNFTLRLILSLSDINIGTYAPIFLWRQEDNLKILI